MFKFGHGREAYITNVCPIDTALGLIQVSFRLDQFPAYARTFDRSAYIPWGIDIPGFAIGDKIVCDAENKLLNNAIEKASYEAYLDQVVIVYWYLGGEFRPVEATIVDAKRNIISFYVNKEGRVVNAFYFKREA